MAVAVEFTADNAKLLRGVAQLEKKVESLQQKLKAAGQTGRRSGEEIGRGFDKAGRKGKDAFDPKRLAKFAGGLVGAGSVFAAITSVNRGWEIWLKNMREISAESRKATREIISFAALQEGGTKGERVQRAAGLAAQFGVDDRGLAFDTVQALQSALGGDFERGLSASRTVFAASQVGIPVEKGRELEILGASQGQAPGVSVRRAFAAGQASARDPAVIAGAAAAFKFFADKEFAFAVAGVLAGSVDPGELRTFVKAAGVGLSGVSTLAPTFEQLGVAGASRREKLEALRQAGLTTPEALKGAGLGELRQQEAISTLVQNLGELDRIQAEIREKAVPGLFPGQRAAVEREIPEFRIQREIDSLRVLQKNEQAFGPVALEADKLEREERIRGIAFQRTGDREILTKDIIDPEGRSTSRDELIFRILKFLESTVRPSANIDVREFEQEKEKVRQELEALQQAAQSLERAATTLERAVGGGPALKRPEVDK